MPKHMFSVIIRGHTLLMEQSLMMLLVEYVHLLHVQQFLKVMTKLLLKRVAMLVGLILIPLKHFGQRMG